MSKPNKSQTSEDEKVLSHRVSISQAAMAVLADLAEQYKCTYRGRYSLSGLLNQIADGRLILSPPKQIENQARKSKIPLIDLEIKVVSHLNGTFAKIAGIISKFNGNIYSAKSDDGENGKIRMSIHLSSDKNLHKLMSSLREIRIDTLIDLNDDEQLEKTLKAIDSDEFHYYEKQKNNKSGGGQSIKDYMKTNKDVGEIFKKTFLIERVALTIIFRICIKNIPGTLSQLATEIAMKKVSIISLNINTSFDNNYNIVCLHLGFGDNINRKISSIEKFMDDIKTFCRDYVLDIEQHHNGTGDTSELIDTSYVADDLQDMS